MKPPLMPLFSAFARVDAGSKNIAVQDGVNINASRALTLDANKVYTVLLVGVPGSTEPCKAVQIRFVANGSITP